mmetsp:Transcript_6650/g.18161  ORF Transcript_6650/g.18161 Transcript_6650/m.18161 type:complete len:210 (+) Transcript_6650:1134-1763(+)
MSRLLPAGVRHLDSMTTLPIGVYGGVASSWRRPLRRPSMRRRQASTGSDTGGAGAGPGTTTSRPAPRGSATAVSASTAASTAAACAQSASERRGGRHTWNRSPCSVASVGAPCPPPSSGTPRARAAASKRAEASGASSARKRNLRLQGLAFGWTSGSRRRTPPLSKPLTWVANRSARRRCFRMASLVRSSRAASCGLSAAAVMFDIWRE